jgi:hypothetical protein
MGGSSRPDTKLGISYRQEQTRNMRYASFQSENFLLATTSLEVVFE